VSRIGWERAGGEQFALSSSSHQRVGCSRRPGTAPSNASEGQDGNHLPPTTHSAYIHVGLTTSFQMRLVGLMKIFRRNEAFVSQIDCSFEFWLFFYKNFINESVFK
jgi:hypothetical protein